MKGQTRQLCFSRKVIGKRAISFGGEKLKGRKTQRPLSTKHALHLILKSNKAITTFKNTPALQKIIVGQARKYGIKLHNCAFDHTHLHLLIRIPSREKYVAFIRQVSAKISAIFKTKWLLRPWSTIVTAYIAYKNTYKYISQNNYNYFLDRAVTLEQFEHYMWRFGS